MVALLFCADSIAAVFKGITLRDSCCLRYSIVHPAGLGFCHGKKYFCQGSGKTGKNRGKTGKNCNIQNCTETPQLE